ncbi:MAG: lysylphosphatidylglycerol synthase transmembrane domain-containing protein [Dehalococcoidia bacterium]
MKHVRVLAGVLISALFLYLALRGVHFSEVGAALRGANYFWLVPATAALVASLALRALRWRLLFYPRDDLRFGAVFGAMNVGYLVNDLLPMRLGEVVRAYLLSQVERVSVARAFSTVAVERVLDMVVTLAYLAAVLPFVSLPEGAGGKVAVISLLAVGALMVMMIAGALRERTHDMARIVTARIPRRHAGRLHGLLDQFLHGFAVLSAGRVAFMAAALSLVVWGTAALALYFVLFAFHLRLSPVAPIFVLALVSLSFVVPASPGYVGVFHLAAVSALRAFDVDESVALSYAVVAHIVAFAPPMLLGAGYLWRTGTSWNRIFAFRSAAPAESEHPTPQAPNSGVGVEVDAEPEPAASGSARFRA